MAAEAEELLQGGVGDGAGLPRADAASDENTRVKSELGQGQPSGLEAGRPLARHTAAVTVLQLAEDQCEALA